MLNSCYHGKDNMKTFFYSKLFLLIFPLSISFAQNTWQVPVQIKCEHFQRTLQLAGHHRDFFGHSRCCHPVPGVAVFPTGTSYPGERGYNFSRCGH